MLLVEAAEAAGVGPQVPLLGRPTCMAIPAALAHGVVASTGCIGNRVYTDLGEANFTSWFLAKTWSKLLIKPRPSLPRTRNWPTTTAGGVRHSRRYRRIRMFAATARI